MGTYYCIRATSLPPLIQEDLSDFYPDTLCFLLAHLGLSQHLRGEALIKMIIQLNDYHLLNAHYLPALTDLVLTMNLSPNLAWGGAGVLSQDPSTYQGAGT